MKYLITGRNGQLAHAFIRSFEQHSIEFVAPDESHLDITDRATVADAVETYKPDIIINCAAYNLVDKAEQSPETAFAVNAVGPRNLAQVAADRKALLVHFGSDYVFDGLKENGQYTEDDATKPLNEYGRSKLAGELYVLDASDRNLVLRLSWVFGAGKQNFIFKLAEWAKSSDYLKIACDEFSAPTHTDTVVEVVMKALEAGMLGRYHLTNTGFCSRYEWAKEVLRNLGIKKFIRPVSMADFDLPAKRPKFSAMTNARITKMLNISIPSWEEAVRSFLQKGK